MLIPCFACEARFTPDEYFAACHDYHRGRDLVAWTCPRCGNRDELRVLPGELGFGYPSRGGYMVEDRFRVPGLRRRRAELRLDISLDKRVWRVSSRTAQPAHSVRHAPTAPGRPVSTDRQVLTGTAATRAGR